MPGDFRCDRGDYARMLILFCMRGCGRIERPAFPAPSDLRRREIQAKLARKAAARSRSCALNRATQKHSSCPGLTRASIYFAGAFSKQMDCRVKPGNDILMAFARIARRDREAVSVHGGLFENPIRTAVIASEAKQSIARATVT